MRRFWLQAFTAIISITNEASPFSHRSESSACTAAHCFVEFYAVVTGMPGKNRVQPPEAQLFLNDARNRLTLVALDEREYGNALEDCAYRGISGGAVYDALIAACALKAKSQTIYSWNIHRFQRLCAPSISQIKEP